MAKRSDAGMALIRDAGPTRWLGNGHWQHPWLVRDALCPDGRRRTVYLGEDADTYFSWPGKVKIAGKWIKGFVTIQTEEGLDSGAPVDTVFTPERLDTVPQVPA